MEKLDAFREQNLQVLVFMNLDKLSKGELIAVYLLAMSLSHRELVSDESIENVLKGSVGDLIYQSDELGRTLNWE